jgi:hypothetical protein
MKRIKKATFVVAGQLLALASTCTSFRTGLHLNNFDGHGTRAASVVISKESRPCFGRTPNQQKGRIYESVSSRELCSFGGKHRRLSMTSSQARQEIISTGAGDSETEGGTGSISSSSVSSTGAIAAATTIATATTLLSSFDRNQAAFAKEENIGMGGGVSASMYAFTLPDEELSQLRNAVLCFATEASRQRAVSDRTYGRVMLGICAEDCGEGLATLGVRK